MPNLEKLALPDNTAFKQQRLPAWQPILTAKAVFPTFFVVSIIFIPIGVVLLVSSQNVVEFSHDYTDCISLENPAVQCSTIRLNRNRMNETCTCQFNFTLDNFDGDVFAYYGLSNFFQNHRRYVKSRDDRQLLGVHVDYTSVSTECQPYAFSARNLSFPVYAPCGAIANSFFNDTYTLSQGSENVPFLKTGIAWPSDHTTKFNNPSPTDNLDIAFSVYQKPLFWQRRVQDLDTAADNNGYENEDLIVWMRTAAFPHFRKPYGRLDRSSAGFIGGLRPGEYTLMINYNYPVTAFFGRKRFLLSTTSWMGGKNDFLGIAYIVFGCLCFFVGALLFCVHNYAKKIHAIPSST